MSSDPALRVTRIGKCYEVFGGPYHRLVRQLTMPFRPDPRRGAASADQFWALRNVSFDVARGESLGILGRNGSGKSTLLQIICGTLRPTLGEVEAEGRIGALLELGAGFNPEFTGRENVQLNATIMGLSAGEIAGSMDEILAFADIGAFVDQPVRTYSSGMFVRLAFAVQACLKPDILVVDEALAVGDERFQRKCYAFMDSLREAGTAIILVTHSTATIEKYCDRAMLLHRGEMHGIGATNVIIDQYHALLYADEGAYLRLLNANAGSERDKAQQHGPGEYPHDASSLKPSASEAGSAESASAKALIVAWSLRDEDGTEREFFRPGERATLTLTFDCLKPIGEVQVGIAIRTIEGVLAYGTSTDYRQNNIINAKPGQAITVSFDLILSLSAGSYFISLAVAEKLDHGDMHYIDKRTDRILLRMQDPHVMNTGIAYLDTRINHMRR